MEHLTPREPQDHSHPFLPPIPHELNLDANTIPPPMALSPENNDATNDIVYVRDGERTSPDPVDPPKPPAQVESEAAQPEPEVLELKVYGHGFHGGVRWEPVEQATHGDPQEEADPEVEQLEPPGLTTKDLFTRAIELSVGEGDSVTDRLEARMRKGEAYFRSSYRPLTIDGEVAEPTNEQAGPPEMIDPGTGVESPVVEPEGATADQPAPPGRPILQGPSHLDDLPWEEPRTERELRAEATVPDGSPEGSDPPREGPGLAELETGNLEDATPMVMDPKLGGDLGTIAYSALNPDGPAFAELSVAEQNHWTVKALGLVAHPDDSDASARVLEALEQREDAAMSDEDAPFQPSQRRWKPDELRPALREAVRILDEHGINVDEIFKTTPTIRQHLPYLLDPDKTNQEISAELGVADFTVPQNAARAMEKLQRVVPAEIRDLLPQPTGSVQGELAETRGHAGPSLKEAMMQSGRRLGDWIEELTETFGVSKSAVVRTLSGESHPNTTKLFGPIVANLQEKGLLSDKDANRLLRMYQEERVAKRSGATSLADVAARFAESPPTVQAERPAIEVAGTPALYFEGKTAQQPIADRFQEQLQRDPQAVKQAIENLKDSWIESTLPEATLPGDKAQEAVASVLTEKVDWGFAYDPDTEHAMDADPEIQQLLQEHRNATNPQIQEKITRQIRLTRLEKYIERFLASGQNAGDVSSQQFDEAEGQAPQEYPTGGATPQPNQPEQDLSSQSIGSALDQWRMDAGLTKRQLAQDVGLSEVGLHNLLTNEASTPLPGNVAKLVEALKAHGAVIPDEVARRLQERAVRGYHDMIHRRSDQATATKIWWKTQR